MDNNSNSKSNIKEEEGRGRGAKKGAGEGGKAVIVMVCGSLVYYHCAYANSTLLSLFADVLLVLLCSLAILGLLFRHLNIDAPVDPVEWQISQDTANSIVARLANTIGAAESVFRVAATAHDNRLFLKVVATLYVLSALGRLVSGFTVAYAGLCLCCLYMLAQHSQSRSTYLSQFMRRNDHTDVAQDNM